MSDTGHQPTQPVGSESRDAEQPQQLLTIVRRLQYRSGEQFAAAVNDGRLDIEVANSLLEASGMPPLPRRAVAVRRAWPRDSAHRNDATSRDRSAGHPGGLSCSSLEPPNRPATPQGRRPPRWRVALPPTTRSRQTTSDQ